MLSSLQYPLELHRNLEARWRRLLRRTATPIKCGSVDALMHNKGRDCPGSMASLAHLIAGRVPPRHPDGDDIEDHIHNDDEEEDDEPEGHEPAIIREPDKEE